MKWLIFQQGRYFGGSCPEGAVWEGPRENYVNASIPKDKEEIVTYAKYISEKDFWKINIDDEIFLKIK